jgi:hypothetical protein
MEVNRWFVGFDEETNGKYPFPKTDLTDLLSYGH